VYRGISIQEEVLSRNVERFRGGFVFKAHRLLYHSTLGLMVKKKKKKKKVPRGRCGTAGRRIGGEVPGGRSNVVGRATSLSHMAGYKSL